jgi:hypothetical protein
VSTTFDPALATARDRLRFDLGDTHVGATKAAGADVLALPVDDAVYAGALARRGGDEDLAYIDLADALIAKYAQMETKASVDGVESAEWANRLAAWREGVARRRAKVAAAAPTVPGRGSFSVARAHRPGCERAAEYYAGGRPPLDRGDW